MSPTTKQNFERYKKYSTDLRRYYRMPAIQTSLSLVLSLFIVAFFILFALRPTFVTITTLRKTISDSRTTLKQLQGKATTLESIAQMWETVGEQKKFIDNSIPDDGPRYQSFIKSMEILARENGVELISETVGEALTYSRIVDPYTGKSRTVVNLPFTLRVNGTYGQVKQFFTSLTQVDRLITLESIAFVKDATNTEGTPGLAFNIAGNVHYLADEAQLSTALNREGAPEARGSAPATEEEIE